MGVTRCKLCERYCDVISARSTPNRMEMKILYAYGVFLSGEIGGEQAQNFLKVNNGKCCRCHSQQLITAYRKYFQVNTFDEQFDYRKIDELMREIEETIGISIVMLTSEVRTFLSREEKQYKKNENSPVETKTSKSTQTEGLPCVIPITGSTTGLSGAKKRKQVLEPDDSGHQLRVHGGLNQFDKLFSSGDNHVEELSQSDDTKKSPCEKKSCRCCRFYSGVFPDQDVNSENSDMSQPVIFDNNNEDPDWIDSQPSTKSSSSTTAIPAAVFDPSLPKEKELAQEQYYLVKGNKLLELFRNCPRCGRNVDPKFVKLLNQGTAPIVHIFCPCSRDKQRPAGKWYGQEKAYEKSRRFEANVNLCVSAYTCGMGYNLLKRTFGHAGIACFGQTTFTEVTAFARKAVLPVFEKHQLEWKEYIRENLEKNGEDSWVLAADGAYDSRGHSAIIGKSVVCELSTGLVVDVETMSYDETGFVSGRMEIVGTRRILERLMAEDIQIDKVITDRSLSFAKLMREMELDHGFDAWHIVKSVGNKIREATKKKDCEILKPWFEEIKKHLWYSIQEGNKQENGEMIRFIFNSCLHHCVGEHVWRKNMETTGPYNRCGHDGPHSNQFDIPKGSAAYEELEKIVLQKRLQSDLLKADIRGTSKCEVKNGLDNLYCSKQYFYDRESHDARSKMTALHLNTLTLAELKGERKVIAEYEYQLKYLTRKSKRVKKNSVIHHWRPEIRALVLKMMMAKDEEVSMVSSAVVDDEEEVEEDVEDEEIEDEDDFSDIDSDSERKRLEQAYIDEMGIASDESEEF